MASGIPPGLAPEGPGETGPIRLVLPRGDYGPPPLPCCPLSAPGYFAHDPSHYDFFDVCSELLYWDLPIIPCPFLRGVSSLPDPTSAEGRHLGPSCTLQASLLGPAPPSPVTICKVEQQPLGLRSPWLLVRLPLGDGALLDLGCLQPLQFRGRTYILGWRRNSFLLIL